MTSMNYIGLDVHKKTISYCVEGREWPSTAGRQGRIDPARAGLLDENAASTVDSGHGGYDLQRLDLRSSASARCPGQGSSSTDVAGDCSGQEEERQDRCRQDGDCLRCDFLPECHMLSTEIRDRRRILHYRHLVVRQMYR
jgi:transposase